MKEYEIRYDSLPNKVRTLEIPILGAENTACVAFVKTGSRNENPEKESGISHLLEHVVYHGTKRYRSQEKWSDAVDGLGPYQNADTDYENTRFYIHAGGEYTKDSLKLLGELLARPLLTPEAIKHEKKYIQSEMASEGSVIEDAVRDLFEQLLFEGTALGNPINGNIEILKTHTQRRVQAYKDRWYRGGNILVVVAGKVGRIKGILEDSFGAIPQGPIEPFINPPGYGKSRKDVHTVHTPTDDVHFALGFPGVPLNDPRYYALKVAGAILGGNDSIGGSLLYQNIQTKNGGPYDLKTYLKSGSDFGYLAIQGAVSPVNLEKTLGGVQGEVFKLAENITAKKMENAKRFLVGDLKRGLESTLEVAHTMGIPTLLYDKVVSRSEIVRKIKAVSLDDVKSVANELLKPEEERLLVFGPVNDKLRRARKFNPR